MLVSSPLSLTFENVGGQWGFKHEDIYFMGANGRLNVL